MLPHQLLSFTVGGTLRRAPPGPTQKFFGKVFQKGLTVRFLYGIISTTNEKGNK